LNEEKKPGEYEMGVDVSDVQTGVYVVRMQGGDHVETKKLVVF